MSSTLLASAEEASAALGAAWSHLHHARRVAEELREVTDPALGSSRTPNRTQ